MVIIQAKPTKYKDYTFRSQLEAQWAYYLDALRVKYIYERDTYIVVNKGERTWYKPDFYLPEQELWLEVKGEPITPEYSQMLLNFCEGMNQPLALVTNLPLTNPVDLYCFTEDSEKPMVRQASLVSTTDRLLLFFPFKGLYKDVGRTKEFHFTHTFKPNSQMKKAVGKAIARFRHEFVTDEKEKPHGEHHSHQDSKP